MSVGAKARIEEKVFAVKLLEHGMNATSAMKEIKPQLTEGSAKTEASRMLSRVNQVGAIDSLMQSAKDTWSNAIKTAIALAEQWTMSEDKQLQLQGMEYLKQVGMLFANASGVPKNVTQVNKYTLPKR